jgi:hypothetical protein
MSLSKCIRCGIETPSAYYYCCEHTNEEEMCTECYQEIHWRLSNEYTHEVGSLEK